MTAQDGPLAGIHRNTVHSLIQQARLYLDLHTGEYKSSPPERRGRISPNETYVSGRDLEQWPGKLAQFRRAWEARPEEVRAEILRRAREETPQNQEPGERSGIQEIQSLVSWEE